MATTTEQVATEIVALINAQARTPTIAEIAAIIGKAGVAGPDALFHHRAAWRALFERYDAANKVANLSEENEILEFEALEVVHDYEREHLLGPDAPQARTLRDIFLLAEVAFRRAWPEHDLIDGEPPGFEDSADRIELALAPLLLAILAAAKREGVIDS